MLLPLFLKNLLFLLPSRKVVFTGFQGFSSSASIPEVSVWWHLDSCPVPSGVSFSKVAPSIMAAVRANGIMGTIHIRAYGDFNSSGVDKEALKSTNISLYSSIDYPSSYIEKIVTEEREVAAVLVWDEEEDEIRVSIGLAWVRFLHIHNNKIR
ncbi:helicase-like protein [Trifolium pratense]|uniref:Helicase-like protein n=1 Tax=Trifolium pratense TaxID=57577 RepID=A0A2K3NKJ9_TRIPR|nr:helicase-like protein [Trifolium pratense]